MREDTRIALGRRAKTCRIARRRPPSDRALLASLRIVLACALLAACGTEDARQPDVYPDAQVQTGFGRRCNSDDQCESHACVPHIGDTVCSQSCDPNTPCPDSWTCWTPPGATNFAGSYCVSPHWALCRPCSADADCASVSKTEPGACINYNDGGTFCGSDCTTSADCPEGFSCNEGQTRTGRQVRQCTNNTGMCECNAYISSLGEATRCATENQWGRCLGERTCDSKLWSRCDADTPAPDAPNQRDDDCDGLTDELDCLCGDNICDPNCGETLANCPCDCAIKDDGVCSPCGENPGTSPADCCRGPGGTNGCGDGFCMGFGCQENPATCPQDCSTACGNKYCEPGENPFNCAEDCLHSVCGNHVCEATDGGPEACPQDCSAFCGDCVCDPARDESVFNCAIDCGYCGDGSCSPCAILNENLATCAEDCCVPSPEVCNNIDDDCDGETDEEDAFGCLVRYRDEDGDGLGRWDDARCLCQATSFWTSPVLGDCNDRDATIGLGDAEVCNNRDDDCNGETDEGFGLGAPCVAPGGACYVGVTACNGLDNTRCVDSSARAKGTTCTELVCLDGVIQPPSLCDGAGACVSLQRFHCNGYMCDDSGRCEDRCNSDEDCREGYACGAAHTCERFADPCTSDVECIDEDWTTDDFCLVICGHSPRPGALATGDFDGDTISNGIDNCPETANRDQADSDADGVGDACDRCDGAGSPEVCNNLDDNCDGQTDEGLGVGVSCVADDNKCRVGVRVCAQSTTRCPGVRDAPVGFECNPAMCVGDALRLASRCNGAGTCDQGELISCQGNLCQDGASGPACATTCSDDDGCAAGHHCAITPRGGECAPDLANGQVCGGDHQCASGMCVDGVCCSGACDGGCSTCAAPGFLGQCRSVAANTDPKNACGACGMCGTNGACTNVAAGPSPKDACPIELPCGTTGLCAAGGKCALASVGTACDSASCVAGELTAGTTCDGQGLCRDAITSVCPNDLLCATATTCLPRCASDRDCRVGNYCAANGQCVDLVANGQSCSLDRMCVSGICADGVCCDGRCDGDCQACDLAATRGTCSAYPTDTDPESECGKCGTCNGSKACGPIAAGTDPDNDCTAVAPCGQDGFCDGNYGCDMTDVGTACGTASCVGSTLITARQCDGQGSCSNAVATPCSGYLCDAAGAACRTSCSDNNQCQTGFYCGSNVCKPKIPQGGICTTALACASGFCAEGICCNRDCSGTCEACGDGTCDPVVNSTTLRCKSGYQCNASAECTLAAGRACVLDGECSSGNCGGNGVCCSASCSGPCNRCNPDGTCTTNLNLTENSTDCHNGSWCLGGVCTGKNNACTTNSNCSPEYYCNTTTGTCTPDINSGGACITPEGSAAGECKSGVCNDKCCSGLCPGPCNSCDGGGVCRADAAGTSGGCTNGDVCDGQGLCKKPKGAVCSQPSDCATNRCVYSPSAAKSICCDATCDGLCEACNVAGECKAVQSGFDDQCNSPFQCVDRNICKLQLGQACGLGASCASGFCEDGMCCSATCAPDNHCSGGQCVPDLPLGPGCRDDFECGSGYCINGTCCANGCSSQPDRRCGTCYGVAYNLCNVDSDSPHPDCDNGRTCDPSGFCK